MELIYASFLFLCLNYGITVIATKETFVWAPNKNMRNPAHWKDGFMPCDNSQVFFDDDKTIAFVDFPFMPSLVSLPDVGVLVFADDVVIGAPSSECSYPKQTAFFDAGGFSSVFDPNSWLRNDQKRGALHIHQIPSQTDDVVIMDNTAAQLSIEDTFQARSFRMNNRNFTERSFDTFVRTVEGELQVNLGHEISRERDVDGMQMQETTKLALDIVPHGEQDETYGVVNSNTRKNIMYILCQYYHPPERTIGVCLNPVLPFGHCHPVCGALIDFGTHEVKHADIEQEVDDFWKEIGRPEEVAISLEKTNQDQLSSAYQIALLPRHNITKFDEDLFEVLAAKLARRLKNSGINSLSFYEVKTRISNRDHSFSTRSIVLGCVVFFGALFSIIMYKIWKDKETRRMWITWLSPATVARFTVRFHHENGKDDVVELIEPSEEEQGPDAEPQQLEVPTHSEPVVFTFGGDEITEYHASESEGSPLSGLEVPKSSSSFVNQSFNMEQSVHTAEPKTTTVPLLELNSESFDNPSHEIFLEDDDTEMTLLDL